MLVRIFFLSLSLSFVAGVNAQDSSGRLQQSGQFQQQYTFYTADAAIQPLNPITSHAQLIAGYGRTSGSYRLAQAAPVQQDIFFKTEGTRQLGRYLLSGYFGYTHTLQDSVGYTLRYGINDPDPYYFYAYKKGNWQVGQYRLQAQVSRPFLNDKLLAGAGIRYQTVNAWRSNDPRPEQFNYHTDMEAGLHYRLSPRHSIGLGGSITSRKKESSVQYRNKDYQLSMAYPEYVKRIQYGYGFEDRASNSELKSTGRGYGWQGVYQGKFRIGEVTAKGGYSYLGSDYKGDSTRYFPKGRYGSFYEDRWNAQLLWQYRRQQQAYMIEAVYIHHLGRDFNEFLQTNNYVYAFETIQLRPSFQYYRDSVLQFELGLDLALTDLFRADGNAGVVTDYQYAEAAVQGAWYFRTGKKGWLKTGLTAGIRTAVSPVLTLPSQVSSFVQNVIIADYYYYDATVFKAGVDLLYNRSVGENDGFVRVKLNYDQAQLSNRGLPGLWKTGHQRLYCEAGIGITLR